MAEANFSNITCEADVDFDSCSFYGNYRSDESEYEGAVGFTNALFLGDIDFAGARFTGDAPSFDEAVFAPECSPDYRTKTSRVMSASTRILPRQ